MNFESAIHACVVVFKGWCEIQKTAKVLLSYTTMEKDW